MRVIKMKNISKKQYENMVKTSQEFHYQKTMFDAKIQEIYNGHYSDYDIDLLIDSIDYGQGKISYECFCELMQNIADGNGEDISLRNAVIKKHGV